MKIERVYACRGKTTHLIDALMADIQALQNTPGHVCLVML